jgi:hypothetical protein
MGGTFSATWPKHLDPKTGLPLTIHLWDSRDKDGSKTKYNYGWSEYDYGWVPDQFQLINLPKVFAKHDTTPVEAFFKGITYNNILPYILHSKSMSEINCCPKTALENTLLCCSTHNPILFHFSIEFSLFKIFSSFLYEIIPSWERGYTRICV